MEENKAHILVVDDDSRIRQLLSQYLIKNGFLVSSAKDANEAKEIQEYFIFDLMVLDVMMPGKNGKDFAKELRDSGSKLPIIMLTAMGETEDRITGLESGADDYLAKPFEPRELLLRISKLLQRTKSSPLNHPELINIGNVLFDPIKTSLIKNGEMIILTQTEARLLSILVQYLNKIISREALAELCGGINERSVDVQIVRLRNKMENDPKKPIYLQTIRGSGYVLYNL